MRILLTGATGAVGARLAPALAGAGHEVLAGTRRPESYDGPGRPVAFDLDSADMPDRSGLDAAFYLVHALDDPDFEDVDRERAERFARWWGDEGTVVYLGGLGEPGSASPHLRSRHEVGEILRRGCQTVELRASLVLGPTSASFRLLRALSSAASWSVLPVPVPRAATTRTQPVAEADLLDVLIGALRLAPGVYDVGGPDVLSFAELIEEGARAQGHCLATTAVLPLDAAWLGPAASVLADTDPWTATSLLGSMGSETVVRPANQLPAALRPTTGVRAAIQAALTA